MLAFCEALYPSNAFMRFFCDVRAQLAYQGVRGANNTLSTDEALCPAEFAALAGTDFCFQR
jgi:membrane protein involved in colicin uptake